MKRRFLPIFSAFLFLSASTLAGGAERILLSRLGPAEAALMISNDDGIGEKALTKGTLDNNP